MSTVADPSDPPDSIKSSLVPVAVIAGCARSGTSWLGQIVDSAPEVAYRFQPFFSHAFRGVVDADSPSSRWRQLFRQLVASHDDFLTQRDKRATGEYPTFTKMDPPRLLALKTCRFQYLLAPMLRCCPESRLIGMIRHPCGALNSWTRNAREFPPAASVQQEWRFGACKNLGRESEFFGYYKWKELAHLYLDLRDQLPNRVTIVSYEALVRDPPATVQRVFDLLHVPIGPQTIRFLESCHADHQTSPYAVYKDPSVCDRWQDELPSAIAREIHADLQGTRLEQFCS